jgi:hypothetical protein
MVPFGYDLNTFYEYGMEFQGILNAAGFQYETSSKNGAID